MNDELNLFEFFIASLMVNTDEVAALLNNTDLSLDILDELRTQKEAEFWFPQTIRYFEEYLPVIDSDINFDMVVPLESGIQRYRFALSLWPDFELGVLSGPDNMPFYPHFVRKSGLKQSLPRDLRKIPPWSATLEEIIYQFGLPLHEDTWDLRRWLTYRVSGKDWIVTFDLGLIQNVSLKTEIH